MVGGCGGGTDAWGIEGKAFPYASVGFPPFLVLLPYDTQREVPMRNYFFG